MGVSKITEKLSQKTSNTGCLGHRCGGSGVEGRMVVTPRKAPSIGLPSNLQVIGCVIGKGD